MTKSAQNFKRTYEELEQLASKFWPSELSQMEAQLSVIPLLLKTQDQFISILSIETKNLEKLFELITASSLPANLFLKHLVILADFGGEMLQRVSAEFEKLFPAGKLTYYWQGQQQVYTFSALPGQRFSNQALKVDGRELFVGHSIDELQKDAIALLLFGSSYSNNNEEMTSTLARCEIGDFLGKPAELASFIKQRYIWVSRITGGAKANTLGQIAQDFVAKFVKENLKLEGIDVQRSGHLPGVTQADPSTGRLTSFDLVATDGAKHAAIEVSFQVTTNSTIERKAGQARSRYEQIEKNGHKIVYVVDGAGNFQRENAVRTICSYSHCTVAFSRSELDVLCTFLRDYFTNREKA